jgi:hypothetical protein
VELVQRLADHWDVVLPGRVLHVRYEDLIRDQVTSTSLVVWAVATVGRCGSGEWLVVFGNEGRSK